MMFSKMLRSATAARFARLAAQRSASSSSSSSAASSSAFVNRLGRTQFAATALAAAAAAVAVTAVAVDADAQGDLLNALPEEAKKQVDAARKALAADAKLAATAPQQVLWNAIRLDIEAILEDENSLNPGVDGFPGNSGGGGDVGPMLVRLAWHCSGSYDAASGTGGSNGATMRFKPESDHGGNAGLGHARALLEPIKAKYGKFGITYADLYIFAGCVAIEAMGGPALPFRTGRTDADGPADPADDKRFSPDGRLPDADGRDTDPANHLRDIFHRMGFNDREIVALSGAHAMGRCHTDRSGFWGPWTNAPSTFSNQYFVMLEEKDWFVKRTHKGAAWTGPLQYEDETGELMMLPTDLALVHDREFRPVVAEYYKDEERFASDFAKVWTTLTELGCDGLLSDTPIVNIDSQAADAVENFKNALGSVSTKAKKSSWWPF